MKKIIALIFTIALILSICAFSVSAAGTGSLSMTGAEGKQGDTVTVAVNLSNNPGLITMKFAVSYPGDLELTKVENSGLLGGWTTPAPTISSPYTIRWADSLATTNNTATGKIVTLTFKIKDSATPGSKTVSLTFNESRDAEGGKNTFGNASATIKVNCKSHSYGSYTSTGDAQHSRTCSACGYIETTNHNWNSGTINKPASCKEAGEKTYTCTTCNDTKKETLSKTNDHNYSAWSKVNDTTHKRTCSVCQKEESANHSWNSGTITKPTSCKEAGEKKFTCTTCNATKVESIAKLTTHTYDNACDTKCNICNQERTITHSYKTAWSKDQTNHWHECTVCKHKKDVAIHIPGAEATETTAQTCTACGYVIKAALGHKHNYATTWTTDEAGHWYACAGCEEKGSYAAHDFENACDKDCSVCGLTREIEHTLDEKWMTDATNHWHICTSCGLKQDETAHEPGAEATAATAQTCTICGYEIAPAQGGEETKEPTESTGATTPTTPTDKTNPKESRFPWWIVIAAVVIVAGGTVTAVVIIKKKQ